MSKRVSRAFRGPISVLLFAALAAGGVPFGYYAASGAVSSLTHWVDAKLSPPVEHKPAPVVVAGIDSAAPR
jgi:hypothetical protein